MDALKDITLTERSWWFYLLPLHRHILHNLKSDVCEKAGSSCLLLQRKTNEKKKSKIAKELPFMSISICSSERYSAIRKMHFYSQQDYTRLQCALVP